MFTATPPALLVEGLHKSFGSNKVLDGLDLSVPEGSITALVGESGGGKSVLLKCIAGLLRPDSGEIRIFGDPPGDAVASGVGYLFQGDALLDSLTAWDNVALPLHETTSMSSREIADKVDGILEKLDLGDLGGKFPGDLSGGMRRRVAVARALVLDPRLMLFDEPTTGLDPMRRNAVLEMVRSYQTRFGFTALVVTHDVPATLLIADHLAMLENGKTTFSGPVTNLADPLPGGLGTLLHNEDELADDILGSGRIADLAKDFSGITATFEEAVHMAPPAHGDIGQRLAFPRLAAETCSRLRLAGRELSPIFRLDTRGYLVFVSGGWEAADGEGLLHSIPFRRSGIASDLEGQLGLLGVPDLHPTPS